MINLKALTIALLLAISQLAAAQATLPNLAGAYQTKDKTSSGRRYTLVLLDATEHGRPGSYWGLLIENDLREVYAYIVDPASSNVLGMTPVSIARDGESGVGDIKAVLDETSYDYSLRINYGGMEKGQHRFSVSAGGKNKKGWQGTATFDKKADIDWLPLQPVTNMEWKRGCKITIRDFDSDDNARLSVEKCNAFAEASYEVREKLPSRTYALKADILSKYTGTELPIMPNQIAFFVKKKGKRSLLLTGTDFGSVQSKIDLKD